MRPQATLASGRITWPPDGVILAVLLVVCLLPIWMFDYVPTQDGPSHLFIANVILNYGDPSLPVLSKYFRLDWNLHPNLFVYLALQPLMMVFPPLIAEKVLLTTFVVALPLAARYAVRSPRGDGLIAALLGMQLIYGFTFHMGFYNFSFGIVFFLIGVGYWRRTVDQLRVHQFIVLGLLILVTYFCHIFAALNLIFFIGLAFLWRARRFLWPNENYPDAWDPLLSRDGIRRWTQLVRPAAIHFIAVLPAVILILMFVLNNGGNSEPQPWIGSRRLVLLFGAGHLWIFTPEWEIVLNGVLLIGLLVLIRHILSRYDKVEGAVTGEPFLFVLLIYLVTFMVIPNSAVGSNFMLPRFLVYVLVALLIWLSARQFKPTFRKPMLSALAVLTLVTIGLRLVQYADLNDKLDEYVAGMEVIEPNRTILALSLDRESFPTPFLHAAGYIATLRNGVDLKTVQSHKGPVPVRYRRELDPYWVMADGDTAKLDIPSPGIDIDIIGYAEKTDGQIDYVLLWGQLKPHAETLLRQLDANYELIMTSPKTGLMRLYRHTSLRARQNG